MPQSCIRPIGMCGYDNVRFMYSKLKFARINQQFYMCFNEILHVFRWKMVFDVMRSKHLYG